MYVMLNVAEGLLCLISS